MTIRRDSLSPEDQKVFDAGYALALQRIGNVLSGVLGDPGQTIIDEAIEELKLPTRTYNILKREGIHYIGQLLGWSDENLLAMRLFERRDLEAIDGSLAVHGLERQRPAV